MPTAVHERRQIHYGTDSRGDYVGVNKPRFDRRPRRACVILCCDSRGAAVAFAGDVQDRARTLASPYPAATARWSRHYSNEAAFGTRIEPAKDRGGYLRRRALRSALLSGAEREGRATLRRESPDTRAITTAVAERKPMID